MLKLTLTIGANLFEFQDDDSSSVEDVLPAMAAWLEALPSPDAPVQLAIDRLTARLAAANTQLLHDVGAATPAA